MRRVVVTGLGTINPLGNTVESSWAALLNAQSGITQISKFNVACFRPELGISSNKYFDILGKKVKLNIKKYKPLKKNYFY